MNIVILAAGMGKRMHSVLPKVLQPLAGRPMLEHVLEATSGFSSSPRVVVVGHRAEDVKARFGGRDDVTFALQEPQLGTGHALKVAFDSLDPSDPKTLVCLGDVPLLSRETIAAMQEEASGQDLVLLTVELPDPTGYGRIVRDEFVRNRRVRRALAVFIEDTGPGIPEALRERLFYPLVTGRPEGSGLGLSIADAFVREAGGAIDVESEPGHTVFRVLLPL